MRNLPGFLRFLPVAAICHGQVINISGLARDAATSRTTVEGYVSILEDTLLASRLPAFEPRIRVRERKHPKLYWVDPGIVRAARKQLGTVGVEGRGALLEGWMLTVLRAHNARQLLFEDVSYWAPLQARTAEVDFLLRRAGGSIWPSRSRRTTVTRRRSYRACARSPACLGSHAGSSCIWATSACAPRTASTCGRSASGWKLSPQASSGREVPAYAYTLNRLNVATSRFPHLSPPDVSQSSGGRLRMPGSRILCPACGRCRWAWRRPRTSLAP